VALISQQLISAYHLLGSVYQLQTKAIWRIMQTRLAPGVCFSWLMFRQTNNDTQALSLTGWWPLLSLGDRMDVKFEQAPVVDMVLAS
jgi:hypothetical protein